MRLLKQDAPIIIFYLKEGGRIGQPRTRQWKMVSNPNHETEQQNGVGWLFTHTEKYLNRDKISRRDSTIDFQKELDAMLGEDAIQLFFSQDKTVIRKSTLLSPASISIGERWIAYNGTTNPRSTPALRRRRTSYGSASERSRETGDYRP